MEESKSKISATSMLGLRKLPLGLGKRRSRSRTSSISSKQSTEELSSDPAMAAVRQSNDSSPVRSERQPQQQHYHVETRTTSDEQRTVTIKHTLTVRVYEEALKVRKRIIREVYDVDDGHFDYVNLESYLTFISDERLFHMPKKGSRWDRVLQEAEFFGLLIDEFSSTVGDLVSESSFVRDTALGGCQMLLELGCDQAEALEPTFNVLYEFGHLLGHLIHLRDLFTGNETITQSMSNLYASLVQLIGDIAVTYRQRISRLSSRNNTVSIDFDKEFSHQIRDVWTLRSRLFEHMWSRALRNEQDVTSELTALQRKLAPSTSSEERSQLLYGRITEKAERAEGTCEWVEDDLVDFLESGENLLAITGSPGCGKSVLSAWLRERLQRPIHVGRDRTKFETFGFAFASDNPEESTTLAFLKSMASQLLAINVGDARLLQRLMRSLDEWDSKRDAGKLETDLWAAIEMGLAAISGRDVPTVIIVDALDEVTDGDAKASILSEKLRVIASKLSLVRAITLSRSATQPAKPGVRHFSITPDHLREDIRAYLHACLSTSIIVSKQTRDKQQAFMSLMESRANGSFLYVYLISKLLAAGADFDTLNKSLSSNTFNPLKELFAKVNFKDSGISRLFTFVIAAQRPLTVGEMEDILSVDLTERKKVTSVELAKLVSQTAGLIVIRDGILRFKHASIRSHVLKQQCGQALPSLNDCHRQLTMTLLLFARIHLSRPHDPCLDGADSTLVHQVFRTHHIMEYLVYRWMSHFRRSSLVGKADELSLPSGFKEIFPESTLLCLLEWSTWQEDSTDTIQRHDWALRIRSTCLGEKHPSVLQGLIVLGHLYRSRSDAHKASECFYKACTVGQVILFKFSPIVVSCTTLFLACSDHITFTSRTTICTYREEMVRFMIEVCKGQHGAHSDAVIRWYKVLAQLYVDIKEEYMAAIIYKELQEIIVIRCGRDSKEAWAVRKSLAGLNIVLKKDDGPRSIGQVEETFFESVEDLESTDEMRITILLRLAITYEAECKLLLAERLYLSLWQSISHACRHKATLELRLCHIDIAVKYVRFLERQQRVDEARNILLCLWTEYEHQHFESQTIIARLKELALVFKAFGLLTISVSILKRVWWWFKENKKADDEEAVSTTVILTEVVEEITETITETTVHTTVTETISREIFETVYTRCKSGHVDRHFYKACLSLASIYIKLGKWAEAETIIQRSLELVWKAVLTMHTRIPIEEEFVTERITMAIRLATCYQHQRYLEKADQIYVHIYRACLISLKADHTSVTEAVAVLIAFYQEYHQHEKVIGIYKELLLHYRQHLGASHKLTVRLLYKLAAECMKLGRKEAYEYYIEIVTLYIGKDGSCHPDGFEAAIIVVEYYYRESRWKELQQLCGVLWETVTRHQHSFTEVFIETVYTRYRYVLEVHAKCDFAALYRLTVQYRDVVRKCFDATAVILVTAMLALAELCERHEEHYHESITIYEEIITKTKTVTTVTETKVRTIKKRLSTLYVTVVTSGKKTDGAIIERGCVVCRETYEQLQVELGWWHETTLLALRELVLIYSKRSNSREIITELLQASIVKIISTVQTSKILYDAAILLASIYVAVGMQQQGQELLRQLRLLLLFPDFAAEEPAMCGQRALSLKFEAKSTKVTLIFLLAFDEGLAVHHNKDSVCGFSHLMAELLMESLLYEQYTSVVCNFSESTNIEVVLEHAARLRYVWLARGRTSLVNLLDKKVFTLFMARYGQHLGDTKENAAFTLYVALLSEIGTATTSDRTTIDFALLTCRAVTAAVRAKLVEENDYADAHAVAGCGFRFAETQRFYHRRRECLVYGYRLAELLAGHGVPNWKSADAGLNKKTQGASKIVLQVVMAAMKESGVEPVNLRFDDLSSLIHLLYEQENYEELERVLLSLWHSREVQRTWSTDIVLRIGSLLVEAHARVPGHLDRALELCGTMYYNVRQSRGGSSAKALDLGRRLTSLLQYAGRAREAGRVHERVLHDLDEMSGGYDDAGCGQRALEVRRERMRAAAETHLEGMRMCGWGGSGNGSSSPTTPTSRRRSTAELYQRLAERYGKLGVPPVDKWEGKSVVENGSKGHVEFGSVSWVLHVTDDEKRDDGESAGLKRDSIGLAKQRWGCWGKSPEVQLVR
ncbi:hypothetical protein PG997_010518 [Apiospora hydei]|uniref:Nephrocystin 3-like N-terminal domain-containing protein n=1 Tax=Apiospora hydei TaxID=1337664 RepID=A0ABR1VX71_9PEZI